MNLIVACCSVGGVDFFEPAASTDGSELPMLCGNAFRLAWHLSATVWAAGIKAVHTSDVNRMASIEFTAASFHPVGYP